MSLHLHLLGGAGRIGSALVDSLLSDPLVDLGNIWIYCDLTKVLESDNKRLLLNSLNVRSRSYSAFSLSTLLQEGLAKRDDKHLVINLRGVNNKVYWLNQPLDALELQIQSCRCLVDSDLWMFPGVEIIHMSSQLCDLIESPVSLEEMCNGQESYRRPYMISRLHQEAMLSANAYQHRIPTSFLRLPAVYGFPDDISSPWVLNSLCKQLLQEDKTLPRHPERLIYLLHRHPLLECLRGLISASCSPISNCTVRYLRPPMLQMSVKTLALLVENEHKSGSFEDLEGGAITLVSDAKLQLVDQSTHLKLLEVTIRGLLKNG
jgi:nucleoside-diphosphate-sugar epimerase